jgi:hypothetical protein
MGEQVGYVNVTSGSTSVVIVLKGEISKDCLEELKKLVKSWAERCGVGVRGVTVDLTKIKKKKPKK